MVISLSTELPPVLNEVTLDKSSVTVNGADGATVNATATSAQGTILTEKVTWSVVRLTTA